MLLGAASAQAVLPLEFKPAHSIGDLLTHHLDALEQEAEDKGGLHNLLANHFAKLYRIVPSALSAKETTSLGCGKRHRPHFSSCLGYARPRDRGGAQRAGGLARRQQIELFHDRHGIPII